MEGISNFWAVRKTVYFTIGKMMLMLNVSALFQRSLLNIVIE